MTAFTALANSCSSEEAPELTLRETASYSLHQSTLVKGASGNLREGLLVWGGPSDPLYVVTSGGISAIHARTAKIVGGFWESRTHSASVISDSGWLFQFDTTGALLAAPTRMGELKVLAAAASPSAWFLLSRRAQDSLVISKIGFDGHTIETRELPGLLDRGDWHAVMIEHVFILTRTTYPFESLALDSTLERVGSFSPNFPELSETRLDSVTRFGRSLPVIRINDGYLQVIANPLSNARYVQVYDRLGRWRRMKPINAPLGLLQGEWACPDLVDTGLRVITLPVVTVLHTRRD